MGRSFTPSATLTRKLFTSGTHFSVDYEWQINKIISKLNIIPEHRFRFLEISTRQFSMLIEEWCYRCFPKTKAVLSRTVSTGTGTKNCFTYPRRIMSCTVYHIPKSYLSELILFLPN